MFDKYFMINILVTEIFTFVLCVIFVGVKLTLSTLIEGKNFNQGGHKIGLGLDVEA